MITDARVFRSDFVPGDVVHRDAEVDTITTGYWPHLDNITETHRCTGKLKYWE
jgi:Cdc6-like AAA superfamily ATPase